MYVTFNSRPAPVNLRNTRIIPFNFQYFEPESLDEALQLLSQYGPEAKILAGGTDLLVKMKMRTVVPKYIVNIKRISRLRYIVMDGELLRIGALTTWRDLEKSELVREEVPALHDAAKSMGSVQVRCMATVGGNLCNASPAADSAPPLLVHEAKAKLTSKQKTRTIKIEELITGPGKTTLRSDELLEEIIIPRRGKGGSSFIKIGRVAVDLAIASAATYVVVEDGVVSEIRVALGSVAPKPIRARGCEAMLKGRKINDDVLRAASEAVVSEVSPIDDVRSSAWYRREVSKALVYDSLVRSLARARR
ncbi:MAG: xanthine dehydrogenase family protein subunit M [Zestosphaera sp.]